MAFKQPRIPEYREREGAGKYLKELALFLKDFCTECWKTVLQTQKNVAGIQKAIGSGTGSGSSGVYVFHMDEDGHLICTYDSTQPPPLSIDERGHLIYTIGGTDGTDT